jgi:hypothetical protein
MAQASILKIKRTKIAVRSWPISVLITIREETFCTSEQRHWCATLRVPEHGPRIRAGFFKL